MTTRNHALDILRAIAILMVLATHLANSFFRETTAAKALSVGGRGVDLFFVLSGWLLGSQLFREAQTTGTIDIKRFWIRRWLRTLPAYYAVLFVTFAMLLIRGKYELMDWRYLVFLQNYLPKQEILGVTWSLCVEEHFYLLIAPALFLALRSRLAAVVCLLAVGSLIGCHIAGYYSFRDGYLLAQTHVVFEQCLCGVGLAWLAIHRPKLWATLTRFSLPLVLLSFIAIVVAMLNRTRWDWWLPDWGTGGWAIVFCTWILFTNSGRYGVERWRSNVLAFIASRAYSLYLMHAQAIAVAERLPIPPIAKLLAAVVLSFLGAELLYRVIEHPFSQLRERWQATKSPNATASPVSSEVPAA